MQIIIIIVAAIGLGSLYSQFHKKGADPVK